MARKRRYRRRFMRGRRYSTRMYKYRRNKARASKPEVKYLRYIGPIDGSPTPILNKKTASSVLHNNTILLNGTSNYGLLNAIGQGVLDGQRISNKIFVKFIMFKIHVWVCPTSIQTNWLADVPVRFLVHTGVTRLGGPDLVNFFASTQENKCLDNVNLTTWNVFKDKLVVLRPMGNVIMGTTKGYQTPGYRPVYIKVPINREIVYRFTNDIKNVDKDVVNISAIAYNPLAPYDEQLACCTSQATVYYTDV